MAREATFVCACGATAQQSKRGGIRTQCPECLRQRKNDYAKAYHLTRKAKSAEPIEAESPKLMPPI